MSLPLRMNKKAVPDECPHKIASILRNIFIVLINITIEKMQDPYKYDMAKNAVGWVLLIILAIVFVLVLKYFAVV